MNDYRGSKPPADKSDIELGAAAPGRVTPDQRLQPQSVDGSEAGADNANWRGRMPKIIPFDELARCGAEVWIENNGEIYRLRKTKQGKLILTK